MGAKSAVSARPRRPRCATFGVLAPGLPVPVAGGNGLGRSEPQMGELQKSSVVRFCSVACSSTQSTAARAPAASVISLTRSATRVSHTYQTRDTRALDTSARKKHCTVKKTHKQPSRHAGARRRRARIDRTLPPPRASPRVKNGRRLRAPRDATSPPARTSPWATSSSRRRSSRSSCASRASRRSSAATSRRRRPLLYISSSPIMRLVHISRIRTLAAASTPRYRIMKTHM